MTAPVNFQVVDAARCYLFSKKSREIENIPPTAAALLQHTKRAAFQAGHIWGQCLVPKPFVPSPGDWGWEKCDGPRFLRPPKLATSCSAASARRPAWGTASVTGQTCSALHCALAMDSVMETELTAKPNTNSVLHYMPNYMYRGRLSWIQILQLHVFFTGKWGLVIRIAFLTA